MKKITIDKLLNSVIKNKPKILIEKEILEKSIKPLKRMLAIKRGD